MQKGNEDLKSKEQPILTVIQQLKDGRLDPETIDKELRQQCVEVFQGEGYSISTMAQIFQKSEKTLKRDIDDIWRSKALTPSIELAKKIVGEMVAYARIHRDHLMRLARSRDTSVSEKAQSEFFAFKVFVELIAKLQTLGYLPSKPQAIVGEIFHHVDGKIENLDELTKEIVEIEKIADENVDEDFKKDLDQIKTVLEKISPKEEGNNEKEKPNEDSRR